MRYSSDMLNANYEMIIVLQVFTKIFFTFVPITAILSLLAYTITNLID
jgi:hypothetical protein